jgi:hypothetical protein
MILFLQQVLLLQNNQNRFTDNTFYLFKTKKNESAGSLLSLLSNTKKTVKIKW